MTQSATAAQSVTIPDAIRIALQHHQAGRLPQAEGIYRQILQAEPNHPDALNLLGVIAHQVGKHDMAVDLIGKAILIKPSDAGYYANIAPAYQALNRIDDAIAAYSRVIAINPHIPQIQNRLGGLYLGKGLTEQAISAFQAAVAIKPDFAEAHSNLGSALKRLGRMDEAVSAFRNAVAAKPDFSEAYNNLAAALAVSDREDEAIACYEKSIAINPGFSFAYYNLGRILAKKNKHQDAIDAYQKAIALKPDFAEAYCCLAGALKLQSKLDDAIRFYKKALEVRPGFMEALLYYSDVLCSQGKLAEAADIARSLLQSEGQQDIDHYSLGIVLARCGLTDDARRHFELCLANDPEDRQGVRLLLAALGGEPVPEKASESFLKKIYDTRAQGWDEGGKIEQPYRGHELVAGALRDLHAGSGKLEVLDIGCGTGLVGEMVCDLLQRLDGVDLSQVSLDKAAGKGIYSELCQGDLVAFMAERPAAYDAVTAAATLIHFGDLRPVFGAASATLRDNGLFIFTCFPHSQEDGAEDVRIGSFSGLAQGGCYTHSSDYILRLAEANHFTVESLREEVHEYHGDQPFVGLVAALRRQAR